MRRTTLVAALLLMGLSALPTAAQETPWRPNQPDYEWDASRPDSRGPAGLTMDKVYEPGEVSIAYRFNHLSEEDYHTGTRSVPFDALLREYSSAAFTTNRWRHDLELGLGLTNSFTLMATVPFMFTRTDNITDDLAFFQTEASGLGDVGVAALLGLVDEKGVRFHLSGGMTLPTGSIEQTSSTPFSSDEQLPYTMQNGSGTLDVIPGATLQVQNKLGTVGFQTLFTVRLGTNDRDYKYGNQFRGNVWGGIKATDEISASFRVQYLHTADMKGQDMTLDPFAEPASNPLFQSGTRVDLPLGMNVAFREGALAGHRITAEYVVPLVHDVPGLSIGAKWGLQFRWEAVF